MGAAGAVTASLVLVTSLPGAGDGTAVAAAIGVARFRAAVDAGEEAGVVVCEPARDRPRRPALLAAPGARKLESRLRSAGAAAAARGAVCFTSLEPGEPGARLRELCELAGTGALVVAHLRPADWRQALESELELAGATVVADRTRHLRQAALLAIELRRRRKPVAIVFDAPGTVGSRRALAGIDPGGRLGARASRLVARFGPDRGQALPLVLAATLALVASGLLLAMLGAASIGAARVQRAADLAAVSAARSLRDDHRRLFVPRRLPGGAANPRHLGERAYRRRAVVAAREALGRNGVQPRLATVSFPDQGFAPTRVRVAIATRLELPVRTPLAARAVAPLRAAATAEAYPVAPSASAASPGPPVATGGGYSGPLAYRQGEPMRPDAAAAFDRMATAARSDGLALYVTSGFRSDAEQAALFAANPDPRWVAPPGTSLHRCATELDLGPAGAYGWLAANAPRFGFLRRYAWEPWHFGYVAGPEPCSAAGDALGAAPEAPVAGGAGLPAFTPPQHRAAIARAASRWNVSAALLAAQLMAESGFNPLAVSPAGARGIAQFMPATANAYGLRDPFDPEASIDAQAHLMSDLLHQFGSTELALAAYNAGPGAVAACRCIPPYPETRAYVARILGLLGGAGEIAPPTLEVRLVA